MLVATPDDEGGLCVREFDAKKDLLKVNEMEHRSDLMDSTVKSKNQTSLLFDLLGDPLARIRCFPDSIMLVHNSDVS